MCRNIKRLHNLAPAATADEVRASAMQYVRKISGMSKPSRLNQSAIDTAVEKITQISMELLHEQLQTRAAPRSRETLADQARERDQRMRERVSPTPATPAASPASTGAAHP